MSDHTMKRGDAAVSSLAAGMYPDFFERFASFPPHPWQTELGEGERCADRLLRIPTGFGKTLGVLGAWAWHRVERADDAWPRRLVWCLPMRVLVEQTESEVRRALERIGRLWDGRSSHAGKVGVHVLMGGADSGDWHLHPEHSAVLIGTQDMLLSRALNRGYGAFRPRWPMDFGLLNHDCLWVMDEVQIMDVGLATSGQLQAFRRTRDEAGQMLRPAHSWWMSATLQRAWLQTSPETQHLAHDLPQTSIPPEDRSGPLWEDVRKPLGVESIKDASGIAKRAAQAHLDEGGALRGPTLVVVNTVEAAVDIYKALQKDRRLAEVDLRLAHSRFRPHERATWREAFLHRGACAPGTNRIVVATQVIEAGVDFSAGVLITELAPWPSLVQRFGRAARWGGTARVIIVDRSPKDDKSAAPYSKEEIDAARDALGELTDGSPLALEAFEEDQPERLAALYPYAPKHLLLEHELDDLFDTAPDLSGADIDISRFIRSGEERDLQVFWQPIPPQGPDRHLRASREALCAVPFLRARDWLCGKESKSARSPRLRAGVRAWVWSWLDGAWRVAERKDLVPGQTVLVDVNTGGYDPALGWTTDSSAPVQPVPPQAPKVVEELGDAAQDDEQLSAAAWQTVAVHGAQVGNEAAELAAHLSPSLQSLLHLAGRWHDAGKAHEAFQNSICGAKPPRRDLAKAPADCWLAPRRLYPDDAGERRAGFRHELASTLALFAVLVRHDPRHPALVGPWKALFEALPAGLGHGVPLPGIAPNALELEILALSADDFDLLAYLVCCHHGKVRVSWHASPADQEASDSVLRIRGVREGDRLPSFKLATQDGGFVDLPETALQLSPASVGLSPVTGRSWTDRVLGLMARHGVFGLAFLEALLRVADQRASECPMPDPLLPAEHAERPIPTGAMR